MGDDSPLSKPGQLTDPNINTMDLEKDSLARLQIKFKMITFHRRHFKSINLPSRKSES